MELTMKKLSLLSIVMLITVLLMICACSKRADESRAEPNTDAPVQGSVQPDVGVIAVDGSLDATQDNRAIAKYAHELPQEGKISLRVLYAGMPNTARQKDFVSFLSRHFVDVKAVAFSSFSEEQANESDVVILDKDGIQWASRGGNPLSDIKLSDTYSRATLALGTSGAFLYSQVRLKPGYR